MSDKASVFPLGAEPLLGIRLLVVEDDINNRVLLSELLQFYGAQTKSASSVADACSLIEAGDIDVIISDIGLPDGGGNELIRWVRRRPTAHPPLAIAISGFAQSDDASNALDSGFQAFVPKPIDIDVLITTVYLLHRRRSSTRNT